MSGTRRASKRCPACGEGMVPIIYGMPLPEVFEARDRGEVILGGCMPMSASEGCPRCGLTERGEALGEDLPEDFLDDDEPPTDTGALAAHIVEESTRLEVRAERLAGLVLIADGLVAMIERCGLGPAWTTAAARFATAVGSSRDRADEAAGIARRTIHRVTEWWSEHDAEDEALDDRLYEAMLTARLHIPIAWEMVDDAESDVVPAFRGLTRLALAAATAAGRTDDQLVARGIVRHELFYEDGLFLSQEDDPGLWSVTLEEFRLELIGLLAHMMADRRTFMVLTHTGRSNRFVQVLTYDDNLYLESVADEFLDEEPLTADDHRRLLDLGWDPPAENATPNWHHRADEPVDVVVAADLLIRTLVEVHGLETPTELEIEVNDSFDPFEGSPPGCSA
jgi:hypothetical protein